MAEPKQRRLWPLLAASLIGLLVLYVGTIGVIHHYDAHGQLSGDILWMAKVYSAPFKLVQNTAPSLMRDAISSYVEFCRGKR
jgi:hypothetical protein